MIIEGISVAVSAATLILTRLDRRRDMQSAPSDVRTGLVELYKLLAEWHQDAARTAVALEQAARLDRFDAVEVDRLAIFTRLNVTGARLVATAFTGESEISTKRPPNREGPVTPKLRHVLAIYAPEVEDALENAIQNRRQQIEMLRAILGDPARATELRALLASDFIVKLRTSTDDLDVAREQLRLWIADNYPLDSGEG